jgi:hypothetical protein
MDCPRCGFAGATTPSCPQCGVVFAKLREPRPRAAAPEPTSNTAATPPTASAWSSNRVWSIVLAGILLAAAAGWWRVRHPSSPRASTPRPASTAAAPDVVEPPPPIAMPTLEAPIRVEDVEKKGISDADAHIIDVLVAKVNGGRTVLAADIDAAAALQARYPDEKTLQRVLSELLLQLTQQQLGGGRTADAIATLRRAAALPWADARPRMALLNAFVLSADWMAVESYASELLRSDPRNAEAWYALGYALFRQDRNREAGEALRSGLAIQDDYRARALLQRLEKNVADEAGMREQQISHFHVRYDGGEHESIGREVLRALERHYATLASALDHQPAGAIPVILFSQEAYYDASGAPSWAGGSYDRMDGRIRIPIGGLDQNLAPEMDGTLIHELAHAFIHDKSRGLAPREIHEGLAQYMEGHRIDTRLEPGMRPALAQGRLGGVGGFYIEALALVEYLIANRGQGGMNDLLKAMAETGSVDAAFRQVHGQGYQAVRQAWRQRLQQLYG